jgi:hypothetical protein
LAVCGAILIAFVLYWNSPPSLIAKVIERGNSTLSNLALLRFELQPALIALAVAIGAAIFTPKAVPWVMGVAALSLTKSLLFNLHLTQTYGAAGVHYGLWLSAGLIGAATVFAIAVAKRAQENQ